MPRKKEPKKNVRPGRPKLEKSSKKKKPWDDSSDDEQENYVQYYDNYSETDNDEQETSTDRLLEEIDDLSEQDATDDVDGEQDNGLNGKKKKKVSVKAKAVMLSGLEPEIEDEDESNEAASSEVSSVSTLRSNYLETPRDKRYVWLECREIPPLILPETSDDLCIKPSKILLDCVEIYEICRRFCHIIRLSPFLFEDLCAALACLDEQSALLDELHVALLKCLLKDDDAKQTIFGAHDTRDLVNITFHLLDFMTYGEVLRRYVDSDERFGEEIQQALSDCNYPFVDLHRRVTVVKWLCNQFLTTVAAKTELSSDGSILHDDHCRDCGKTGDLLCCDACTAVYHLGCLDPPLSETPANRWLCPVCSLHQLPGGVEGLTEMEKTVRMIRHGSLGFDRHGRHYWFLARRIFIEDETSNVIWYYSSVVQFRQLLLCLDANDLERELCDSICHVSSSILSDFEITEALTDDSKVSERSWLEWDAAKRSSSSIVNGGVSHESNSQFDELLRTVNNMLTESCPVLKKFGAEDEEESINSPPMPSYSDEKDDFKPIAKTETSKNRNVIPVDDPDKLFKLGVDREFTKYINHYSLNTLAKSPYLRAEEKHRDRYMCNRFGLDEDSEYNWPKESMNSTEKCLKFIRHCIITLSSRLPPGLMHPLWSIEGLASWKKQINTASDAKRLSFLIRTFESNIKPIVFNDIFKHSLGLTRFHRQTVEDKEKRQEKDRLKRKTQMTLSERLTTCDPMDENSSVVWVKYTLFDGPPKHEIWKLKDEHYRINGFEKLGGWLWVRRGRTLKHTFYRNHGLLAGAAYESPNASAIDQMLCDLRNGSFCIDNTTADNDEQQNENGAVCSNLPMKANESTAELEIDRPLAAAKLKLNDHLEIVNVSSALSRHTIYYKVAKGSKFLDSLLAARLVQLNKRPSNETSDNNDDTDNTDVCYSPSCRSMVGSSSCYSYECRLRNSLRANVDTKLKHNLIFEPKSNVFQSLNVNSGASDNNNNTNALFKGDKILRIPELHLFRMHRSQKVNILYLPKHIVRRLARKSWRNEIEVDGFNSSAKGNPVFWPYPCIRPYFSTCWRFQMAKAESLHSVALMLRILFYCIRWSDVMKPVGVDSRRSRRLEDSTETREVVKHKSLPPYGLTASYFVRIICVPNENDNADDPDYASSDEDYDPTPWKLRERRKDRERRLKLEQQKNKPSAYYKWLKEEDLLLWEVRNYWATYEKRIKTKLLEEENRAQMALTSKPIGMIMRSATPSSSVIRQIGPNNFSLDVTAGAKGTFIRQQIANLRPSITRAPILRPAVVGTVVTHTSAASGVRPTRFILPTGHNYVTSNNAIRLGSPSTTTASTTTNKTPNSYFFVVKSQTASGEQKVLRIGLAPSAVTNSNNTSSTGAGIISRLIPGSATTGGGGGGGGVVVGGGGGGLSVKIAPKTPTTTVVNDHNFVLTSKHSSKSGVIGADNRQTLDQMKSFKKRTHSGLIDNSVLSTPPSLIGGVDNEDDEFNNYRTAPGGGGDADSNDDDSNEFVDQLPRLTPMTRVGSSGRCPIKPYTSTDNEGQKRPVRSRGRPPQSNCGARGGGGGGSGGRLSRGRGKVGVIKMPLGGGDDDDDDPADYEIYNAAQYAKMPRLEESILSNDGIYNKHDERSRRLSGYVRTATLERSRKERLEQERLDKQRLADCKTLLQSLVNRVCDMEKLEKMMEKKADAQNMRRVYWKRYRVKQKIRQQYEDQVTARLTRWKKEVAKRRQIMEAEMNLIAQQELDNGGLESLKAARDMKNSKRASSSGKRKSLSFTKFPKTTKTSSRMDNGYPAASPKKYLKLTDGVRFKKTSSTSKGRTAAVVVNSSGQYADDSEEQGLDVNDATRENAPDTSCICKRPYDATKFYVGCDLCSRYFHGKCVGVTAQISKRINTWYCPDCQRERQNAKQELYCMCRTPYDESQFYISCDCCDQWFHGKCVGIEPDEGEEIPAFICQDCSRSQNGTIQPMIKPLTPGDVERVESVLNLLERHKMSWPFRNAIDFNKHPKYLRIVQEPMDLNFVKRKLRELRYRFLAEFTNDVSLIFNNARKYFSPESPEFQCATVLDRYFSDRLHELKQEMIKELKNY